MNSLTPSDYKHILNVKNRLKDEFGDFISEIYCYGSRVYAQNQNTDFDILVFTNDKTDWLIEDKISDIAFYYGLNHDILFDCRCATRSEFESREIPFLKEVKSYGIAV